MQPSSWWTHTTMVQKQTQLENPHWRIFLAPLLRVNHATFTRQTCCMDLRFSCILVRAVAMLRSRAFACVRLRSYSLSVP